LAEINLKIWSFMDIRPWRANYIYKWG